MDSVSENVEWDRTPKSLSDYIYEQIENDLYNEKKENAKI